MRRHSGGPVRKIGALRDVGSHAEIVWLLSDAIGDRAALSAEDRILLAEALEEIAELENFDLYPATPALESAIASDVPEVRVAAKKVLDKVLSRKK